MATFEFRKVGEYLGTRPLGIAVKATLWPMIMGDEKVILDFTGVKVVSNSFADECIAKLLMEMPLEELKQRTTFKGLNPLAQASIALALRRRLNRLQLETA